MPEKNKKSFAKSFFEDIKEQPDATSVSRQEVHGKVHNSYGENNLATAVDKGFREINATGDIHSNEMKAKTENSRFNDAMRYSGGNMDSAAEAYKKNYRHNLEADGDELFDAELYGKHPQRTDIKNGDDMAVYAAERKRNENPTLENIKAVDKAKAEREAHKKENADKFEHNLHKYDSNRAMKRETKDIEPPSSIARKKKSFAKSFFEDID